MRSVWHPAFINIGLYRVLGHFFAIGNKKGQILTQNGAKMKRFDPDKQSVEVVMSLNHVGQFQFPFLVPQNRIVYCYWSFIYQFTSKM